MRPSLLRLAPFVLLLVALPASALIVRLTSLNDLLKEATFIVTAKVDTLDPKRPAMMLVVDETLKGKPDFTKLPVLLVGDKDAKKKKEQPDLLDRLEEKMTVVVFISKADADYAGFVYSNGTWFSITGTVVDKEIRWSWTHLEPYLSRTFDGTTAEMAKAIRDGLSGKSKPPAANAKTKPGLGPKVMKKSALLEEEMRVDLGVVVAPLIGGPLALLAMLFPTVFGGWQRWLVLIATVCTTSTLYSLQWWFAEELIGSWWGTPLALWIGMTLANVVGLAWAWGRHVGRVQVGDAPLLAGWVECLILAGVSGVGVVGIFALHHFEQTVLSQFWLPVLASIVAFWVATAYVAWTWIRGPRLVPALASEAAVLLGMVLASVALTPVLTAQDAGRPAIESAATGERIAPELAWSFRVPERGAISSTPVVVGERVYIAAAIDSAFRPYGVLYCLDRANGKLIWSFSDGKRMKQVHSTPAVEGGRIYVGEGYHQDSECKVYCIDEDGKKVWEHACESHTESTPFVAGGRVYVGAGDDGMYCLDAKTGTKVWNFPGFHIDAGPVVVKDRVFVGCGVGDVHKETVMFCLDAAKGGVVWRMPVDQPVWNQPLVADGQVYVATGNGRLNESADQPAGAVLCLRAADGQPIWKAKLPDGVLGRLVLDGKCVYAGCSDKNVYALWRDDGKTAWKRDLGAPIVTGLGVERLPSGETMGPLYVAGFSGLVACLEPRTGKAIWTLDLRAETKVPVELMSSPVVEVRRGEDRRLYLGVTIQGSARVGELHCYVEKGGP